ncbi:MAG: BrnT family toxin [Chloroflexi bacterium]|nr:BrnT family toxin [Chloroflexota bacterium]
MDIERLHWDERNAAHIAHHNVTKEEVEEVVEGPCTPTDAYGGRTGVVGVAQSGRVIAVVLHELGDGVYYMITARDASRQERFEYAQQMRSGGQL